MKKQSVAVWLFFITGCSVSAQDTFLARDWRPHRELNLEDCTVLSAFTQTFQYSPLVETENAVWIVMDASGAYKAIKWEASVLRRTAVWSQPLPEKIVALAHTHNDHLDPKPSEQDRSVAEKLNIWVFTLTRKGIWRVGPDRQIVQQAGRGWYEESIERCGMN